MKYRILIEKNAVKFIKKAACKSAETNPPGYK